MDDFDKALVDLLQKDGRMSFTDIAGRLNVSVSTVRNRYNRLVDDKVLHILGWVDPTKSGMNAYNRITIEVSPSHLIEKVARELMNVEEVSFLAVTSGAADIEINLICRDNKHLMEVMRNKVFPIEGVFRTESTVYYNVYKWASNDTGDWQMNDTEAFVSEEKGSE
ncbi:Lrp/AsnC family transcriptional regulator [Robertkochia aurantiaca]|uniref:Lrp/AsnC family transcriptional regulator n=1 Tax=Robertkochia aurantiaca TaxID=2873700 RepID=UPI001CCE3288|nr:Lrp/AsnC family transcriptional regulator [Robertkochia sp. 3YJGBD-33]